MEAATQLAFYFHSVQNLSPQNGAAYINVGLPLPAATPRGSIPILKILSRQLKVSQQYFPEMTHEKRESKGTLQKSPKATLQATIKEIVSVSSPVIKCGTL